MTTGCWIDFLDSWREVYRPLTEVSSEPVNIRKVVWILPSLMPSYIFDLFQENERETAMCIDPGQQQPAVSSAVRDRLLQTRLAAPHPPPQAVTWQKTTEPETTTAPEPQRSWSVRTWTSTRVRTFHNGRGGTRWDRGAGRGGGGAGRGGRDQDQPHQCRRLRVQGA